LPLKNWRIRLCKILAFCFLIIVICFMALSFFSFLFSVFFDFLVGVFVFGNVIWNIPKTPTFRYIVIGFTNIRIKNRTLQYKVLKYFKFLKIFFKVLIIRLYKYFRKNK
jgi:hypothetical protein